MAGQTIKICFQPQSNYKFLVNKSQNFRIANVATAVSRLLLTYTSRLDVHDHFREVTKMVHLGSGYRRIRSKGDTALFGGHTTEDIKKVERRVSSDEKKIVKSTPTLPKQ